MIPAPADIAAETVRQAGLYECMREKHPNAEWDDPRIPGPERELNDKLIEVMRLAGWQAPWAYCAAFAEGMIILALQRLGCSPEQYTRIRRLITPHVMTTVRNLSGVEALSSRPVTGGIWLARHGNSDLGHAGIVIHARGTGTMTTIEGNTSATKQGAEKERQGDGIFRRERNWAHNGTLRTMGFLNPEAISRLISA